jgi:uncharacterized DUF497 family protein
MPPPKFDWDQGNRQKSVDKHRIENEEAETIFSDRDKLVIISHRSDEIRYLCVGISCEKRILTSYFLVRNGKIRIIGTRVARKSERENYESTTSKIRSTKYSG